MIGDHNEEGCDDYLCPDHSGVVSDNYGMFTMFLSLYNRTGSPVFENIKAGHVPKYV